MYKTSLNTVLSDPIFIFLSTNDIIYQSLFIKTRYQQTSANATSYSFTQTMKTQFRDFGSENIFLTDSVYLPISEEDK